MGEFRDIDMNQHYTVEMIVARSVDGVEQLMARSGLSHVELYYKRNLFAAKIQSTFHKELAHGDRYVIKTKITKVSGSRSWPPTTCCALRFCGPSSSCWTPTSGCS